MDAKELMDYKNALQEIKDLNEKYYRLLSAAKKLYKEADVLREHTSENKLIDWEDESIDGCNDFNEAMRKMETEMYGV